jgi:hypothetical protein
MKIRFTICLVLGIAWTAGWAEAQTYRTLGRGQARANRTQSRAQVAAYQAPVDGPSAPDGEDIAPGDVQPGMPAGDGQPATPYDGDYNVLPQEGCLDGCDSCQCDDCDQCDWCAPRGFWGRVEYLEWFVRGSSVPPLLVSSPSTALPSLTTLIGNERFDTGGRSGQRATIGYWIDDCETVGFQGNFFALQNGESNFSAASDGTTTLARPFINVSDPANPVPSAVVVAGPGVATGTFNVRSNSQVLGAEINAVRALVNTRRVRFDVLGGFRYFRLGEGLDINQSTTSTAAGGVIPVGTVFDVADKFATKNQFYGGQIGGLWEYKRNRLSFDTALKLAIGAMNQEVKINGNTNVTIPGLPTTALPGGGFLALNTNSGTFHRDKVSLIPELAANIRYQVTPLWRANVGYTLLYVTNVARPGDQIDLRIDPNNLPPPTGTGNALPMFSSQQRDLWIQGVNVGLEARF